ncbi:MAG: FHA domain-containing protein [Alistipes sp.]|mgnify:FL=1|nr:FHA domain-containing protein [Alistipes sp.]
MATKKCANGHLYDPAIYGDKCPFCPSPTGSTKVNTDFQEGLGTKVLGGDEPKPTETIGINGNDAAGGATVIRHVGGTATGETGVSENRRLVGLLVSYSANPTGEVYKVYEGRTTIGRDRTCDIPFPNDSHMSAKHLLIQYVEAKGAFRAQEYDKGSANGSYVNGQVYVLGDVIDLKNNDVIVIGGTKFIFLAIPEF